MMDLFEAMEQRHSVRSYSDWLSVTEYTMATLWKQKISKPK